MKYLFWCVYQENLMQNSNDERNIEDEEQPLQR